MIEDLLNHFPDWHQDAACRNVTPDAFYPETGLRSTAALDTCASCPVRTRCLAWALEVDEQEGIWGGLTAKQRRNLKRALAAGARICRKEGCHEQIEPTATLHVLNCMKHRNRRPAWKGPTTPIREWANAHGFSVGMSGPIAADVMKAYSAAHPLEVAS